MLSLEYMVLVIATFALLFAILSTLRHVEKIHDQAKNLLVKIIEERAELACYQPIEIYALEKMEVKTSCGVFHIKPGKNTLSKEKVF